MSRFFETVEDERERALVVACWRVTIYGRRGKTPDDLQAEWEAWNNRNRLLRWLTLDPEPQRPEKMVEFILKDSVRPFLAMHYALWRHELDRFPDQEKTR